MNGIKSKRGNHPLAHLVMCSDITTLPPEDLIDLIMEAEELRRFAPDGKWSIDPRTDDSVLFNPARARRPVDYAKESAPAAKPADSASDCPICLGRTTGILDDQSLSEGRSIVNTNLYPMLLPSPSSGSPVKDPAMGIHLLQWTSTLHEHDWPELPADDRLIAMERLAAVERALYDAARILAAKDGEPVWHVSVIKNAGRSVGGSLEHGHQQIALTNRMPGGLAADRRFEATEGRTFSSWLRKETPEKLIVRDYGAASLSVPPFMSRPFNMILSLADPGKGLLKDTCADERQALADAWSDGITLMRSVLNARGREPAYNIVMRSNPPGGGLYFEFLPYSQEYGGYERAGLSSCQGDPDQAAGELRERLADRDSSGGSA